MSASERVRRSPSSSESTSSSSTSGDTPRALAERIGLGEDEREDCHPLLALGPERPQVALACLDSEVVEVGPGARHAALEVALEPRRRDHSPSAVRRRTRASPPPGRARLRSARTAARGARSRRAARARELRRARPTLGRPRREGARVEEPAPDAPERRRCAVRRRLAYSLASAARAGRSRPTARSRYARRVAGPPLTTASRSGVNTSVVSSCRRRSAELSRSPLRSTRLGSWRASTTSVANAVVAEPAGKPHARRVGVEADHLPVASRARREPLRSDVERLEQVRLAGAVRTVEKHDPRLEAQLERRRTSGSRGA